MVVVVIKVVVVVYVVVVVLILAVLNPAIFLHPREARDDYEGEEPRRLVRVAYWLDEWKYPLLIGGTLAAAWFLFPPQLNWRKWLQLSSNNAQCQLCLRCQACLNKKIKPMVPAVSE